MKKIINVIIVMVMIATCIPAIAFAESKAAPLTIWDIPADKELTEQAIEMIAIHGQKELRAKDAEGKLVSPTWTSSNPSVLQVSQSGLVTTVKPKVGEAVTITATDQNGNQAKCYVTLTKMNISNPDVFLINRGKPKKVNLNKEYSISAIVPSDQISTFASELRTKWFIDNFQCIGSTNENVVKPEDVVITKNEFGPILKVTAIADGNTELTFALKDKEFAEGQATLEIQTKTGIILSKTYTSLSAGEESKIPIKEVLPAANNPEPQFQYMSEDPAVATVDQNGVVGGIANGITNIKIKQTNGQQYTTSYRVTVVKPGLYTVEGGHENTSDMSKWRWVGDTLSVNTKDGVYLRYFTKDSANDGLGALYQSGNANVGYFVRKEMPGEGISYKQGGYFKPVANGSTTLRLMEFTGADYDYRELGECTVTVNVPGFSDAALGNREDYEAQGPQNGTTLKLNDLHISTNTSNQLIYENYINTLVDTKDASFSFTAASAKGDGNKKPDDYVQKYMLDKIKLCNKEMTETIGTFGDKTLILKSVDTNEVQNPTTVKFAIKKEALKLNTEYALVFDDSFRQNNAIEKAAVFYFKTKAFTKATAISLNKTSANLAVNGALELKASFSPKDADDTDITWTTSDGTVAKVDDKGKVTGLKAGTAIIKATNKNGLSASCKITVDPVKVTPTKIKAAAVTYNTAKISWTKVSGATGYAVYGASSKNGKYSRLVETKNLSYTDKGLDTGKSRYYKVRTYTEVNGTKYYSDDSNISSVKPALKSVQSVKAKASYNKVKVSYGQTPGASGYVIYKASKKNGAYKKLAVVKGGKSRAYTDKKVQTGKTYFYKVKAYRNVDGKKVYGKASKAASAKTALSASKLTLKAKKSGIAVKWAKVSGAHKYQLYRSTKKGGKYILMRQTAKRSFTDQRVRSGKTYYYKLRAYRVVDGKKVYSKYTKIVKVKAK